MYYPQQYYSHENGHPNWDATSAYMSIQIGTGSWVHEQLSENSISTDRKSHRFISNVLLHKTRVKKRTVSHPRQSPRQVGQDHIPQSLRAIKYHCSATLTVKNFLLLLNVVSCTFLCTLKTQTPEDVIPHAIHILTPWL